MKREHEAILERYENEGKTHKGFTFYVKHRILNTYHAVPGHVIGRFITDPDSYEISEQEPEVMRLQREKHEYEKLEKEAEETQALADAVAALAAKKASRKVNKENQNNE